MLGACTGYAALYTSDVTGYTEAMKQCTHQMVRAMQHRYLMQNGIRACYMCARYITGAGSAQAQADTDCAAPSLLEDDASCAAPRFSGEIMALVSQWGAGPTHDT